MKKVLDSSGELIELLTGVRYPCTLSLTTAAGSIQMSTDGGKNFTDLEVETLGHGELRMVLFAPATHVKFKGAGGDTCRIIWPL